MKSNAILTTNRLTKRFGKFTAVDALDIRVNRGDIFGFLGPNGAGKSTTIRMILGLIKPDAGEICLFGDNLKHKRGSILGRTGALVEKPGFYNYLSARRNLQLLASLAGIHDHTDIDRVLKIVGLFDRADDKVKSYSHGMVQRLGIAQALLGHPEFIILDEPTTGLDPMGMKEIRQLILNLSEDDITIFLSSHLLHEVEQICNKMAIINNGRLIVEGEVAKLLSEQIEVRVDRPTDAQNALSGFEWVKSIEANSSGLMKISLEAGHIAELNRVLVNAGFEVSAIQPGRSLEDYFLTLVK